MRIVKLSQTEPIGFATLDKVQSFFQDEIWRRMPPGKFHVTPGRIAQDELAPGEPVVFTYHGRVVFTARAASGLVPNDDHERQRFPSYFVVDRATLRDADEELHNVEQWYNAATGEDKNLVATQGWNKLPDSPHTEEVWARLGGSA